MKKTLIALAGILGALLFPSHNLQAQPYYPASLQTVCISTNASGKLTYQNFGDRQLIRLAASEAGLTNLSPLSVVYNRTADALEVVSGTNHTVVATPLTFATGTYLSNTNGTQSQRFAGVYWGTNLTACGSLVAGEQDIAATSRRPARFTLDGQLQFTLPASGTNGPAIYIGNLNAGVGCDGRH